MVTVLVNGTTLEEFTFPYETSKNLVIEQPVHKNGKNKLDLTMICRRTDIIIKKREISHTLTPNTRILLIIAES